MKSILKSFTLPAIALLIGVSSAGAQIIVPNPSFESPAETSDTLNDAGPANSGDPSDPTTNTTITGWTSSNAFLAGYGATGIVYEPGTSQYDGVTGVTGNQAALLFPFYGYVGEYLVTNNAVTTVAANTTYNLTVDAAIPTALDYGATNPSADVSTLALELVDSDGNIFASNTVLQSSISVGSFKTLSLTFTSGAAPSDLNEGLKIEFFDQNSYQDSHSAIELDNVTLSVPEPSTYVMILASMGALVFFARRKLA